MRQLWYSSKTESQYQIAPLKTKASPATFAKIIFCKQFSLEIVTMFIYTETSVAVVSAFIRQLSAETINPKVWSLSAETYSVLSAEILLTLTFLCRWLRLVINVESLKKET